MKLLPPTLAVAVLSIPLVAVAADSTRGPKIGEMSSVQLLATARINQPGGMRFLFLVKPTPGTTGQFTLKETRDFDLDGQSYQARTQAELGRQFEPVTNFDSADGFFTKQPNMRRLAPNDIAGGYILSLSFSGAPLPPDARGEISLQVGFNEKTEPFTFPIAVPPPADANPNISSGGAPSVPADGRTRYVTTEGVAFAPWTLDLKMADGTVTGAVHQGRRHGNMATGLVGPFEIFDGKIEASAVTFKARTPTGDRVITFAGEIVGDEIRFKRTVAVAPGAVAGSSGILGGQGAAEFTAKKVVQ
jgi:hypothetical protein